MTGWIATVLLGLCLSAGEYVRHADRQAELERREERLRRTAVPRNCRTIPAPFDWSIHGD